MISYLPGLLDQPLTRSPTSAPASAAPSSLLSKSSLSEHLKHQMVNLFHSKMQGFCLSIEIKAQVLRHLLSSPHTLISFTVLSSSTTPHTRHLVPATIVSLLPCKYSPRAPAIADPSAAPTAFPQTTAFTTLLKYHLKKTCLHHPIKGQNPFFFYFYNTPSSFNPDLFFICPYYLLSLLCTVC